MRAIRCEIALGAVMIALGTAPGDFAQAADEVSKIVGTWRGDSVCIAKNTACHDEDVVYRVTKLPERSDYVSVSADKIVNGSAINMGTLDFHYDQRLQSWVCEYPQGTWRIKVDGAKAAGALTRADGTPFRHLTLRRNP
jgi:hypothetical protein